LEPINAGKTFPVHKLYLSSAQGKKRVSVNKRLGRLLCLVLLSLSLFSAMNAPTATAQPSQGDWIITAVEVAENETAPASIPATIKLVGQIGGPTQAVAAKENYVYVGVGLRLVVLDVSNPAVPREGGATRPLAGFVKDVAIANSTAYVVDGVGLWVVDVSNPAHPNEVGFYGTPGYAEGVTVAGRYAYVADGWAGFRVVDISDQAHPTEVGFAYTLGYAFDVAAVDDIAYIAGAGAGLRVVDISDPTHPTEIEFYDTPGYAYGIAVAGSTVYIADGWEGLRVVDVSDPANPTEIGFYDTPGQAFGLAIVSGTAYVADAFAGLRVVDISVPASPTEVGAYEVRGHAGQVVVAGGMVFVADRDWGLRVVDVSNPIHPAQVGFYGPLGYADGVAVAGDHAYVAAATYGMRVVNISDPSHPTEVGGYDTNSYATSVAVSGNYAYVATMPGQPGDGLHVVEVIEIKSSKLTASPAISDLLSRKGEGYYKSSRCFDEGIAYAPFDARRHSEVGIFSFDEEGLTFRECPTNYSDEKCKQRFLAEMDEVVKQTLLMNFTLRELLDIVGTPSSMFGLLTALRKLEITKVLDELESMNREICEMSGIEFEDFLSDFNPRDQDRLRKLRAIVTEMKV